MPLAVITGTSKGLGLALAEALAQRGWDLIVDARDAEALSRAVSSTGLAKRFTAVAGDVSDAEHRVRMVEAARSAGSVDLLVNNASTLGPSPQPKLARYPIDQLAHVYSVNVFAPLALLQALLPSMSPNATVVNVTSDAAVEPYEGWGGYGSSKAALEQLSAILGAEEKDLRVYAFDPGDMRTAMHQAAFPDEDISDRPEPETVVEPFLKLLDDRPPSGRYTAEALRAPEKVAI